MPNEPGLTEFSAAVMARLLDVSLARVGQLAKEGVIEKLPSGKYLAAAIPSYIGWLRAAAEKKNNHWSVLLEQEKYRKQKRENDVEERLVAPVQVLEDVLGKGIAAMLPVLEGLPLVMKRHFPELTGDQISLVKQGVAECRNALADVEIVLDDD